MIKEIIPNIYKIDVLLPRNPLKNLNCYVIKGHERNLIIDTGFNIEECLESLLQGIEELGLNMDITDVLVTHLHSDHCGLVHRIISKNSKVYMNPTDAKILNEIMAGERYWDLLEDRFIVNGFPKEELVASRLSNPAKNFVPDGTFDIVPIEDGSKLSYGGYEFIGIKTPGHTPGHMCLYCEKEKLMFTGDHVLFGITPNITPWEDLPNSLGSYMESLKRIKEYDVELALAGHREITGDFEKRIDAILTHHEERLQEAYSIIADSPGINAYNIASKMTWSIRAKDWSDFPVTQKWFAVGEAMAHLNYLVEEKKIKKVIENNRNTYYKC